MVARVHLSNNDSGDDILLSADSDGIITITSDYNGWSIDGASGLSAGATTGANVVIDSGVTVDATNWRIGTTTSPITVTVKGTLTLSNSDTIANGSPSSTVVVADGGTLILGGYATTTMGLIQFSGSEGTASGQGGTIEIAAGTTPSILGYITNITPNDTIIIDGIAADGYTYVDSSDDGIANGVYTLTSGGTAISGTSSFQLPEAYEGSTFTVSTINGKTYLNVATVVCFLAGSMIRTPVGEVAVETLQTGDEVITLDWRHGLETVSSVVWAGTAHTNVRPHLSDDQAGWPVRVLKGAISEGVPYKDMLITSEHCLFFDGKFVPVRMLVNGSSIFYDKSITSYDYFHIETEQHSVLIADGVLAESYIDTGNRRSFQQNSKIVSLRPANAEVVQTEMGAPLDVSRDFVEPLFNQLTARAEQLGFEIQSQVAKMTNDADLHLQTAGGMIIRPAREANGRVMFMIPAGVESVRIVSNASRPSDVVGPFVDDRRQLGVLVGEITMFDSASSHTIDAHLTQSSLTGWHAVEGASSRWTNGNAQLPLGKRNPDSVTLVSIEIKSAGPYLLDNVSAQRVAHSA